MMTEQPCPNCGKPVRQILAHGNRRQVFCSRECSEVYKKKQTAIRRCEERAERTLVKTCSVCGSAFETRRMTDHLCSDECRREDARRYSLVLDKGKHISNSHVCRNCGRSFVPEYGNKRRDFCSQACLLQWSRHQDKQRRRALLKGATTGKFTDRDIFERDHWVCQICGQPVDREPSLAYNPLAVSLDHIKPLARGGSHTRENVRCVHLICNSYKSDADDVVARERMERTFDKQMAGRGHQNLKQAIASEPAVGDETTNVRVLTLRGMENG